MAGRVEEGQEVITEGKKKRKKTNWTSKKSSA